MGVVMGGRGCWRDVHQPWAWPLYSFGRAPALVRRYRSSVACVALGWPRTAWGLIPDEDIAEYTIISTGCRVEPCYTRPRDE